VDIILQTDWGWEIAMDLFLGGLGASCFLITSILFLSTKDKYKKTIKFGAWASVISLIAAVAVLMLHVGVPGRALLMYKSFVNFNSWMPVGAWSIFCGTLIFGLYALANTEWITNKIGLLKKCRAVLAIVGILFALLIVGYTGLLLSAIWAHPLWNTLWLPGFVMASAFCMGTVLITAYTVIREDGDGVDGLQKVLKICSVALTAVSGIVLGCYLGFVSSGSEVAAESVEILTSGAVSSLFWVVGIGCGLLIPLLVNLFLLVRRDLTLSGLLPMLGVVCCLVGGFTLRLVILMAGLPIYA
jgi:formate-dependent nitrite reductase membrane component NrfD